MHARDYSEDMSRIVDEEVSRILREQEERARKFLKLHLDGARPWPSPYWNTRLSMEPRWHGS